MFKKLILVTLVLAFAAVSFAADKPSDLVAKNLEKLVAAEKAKAPKVDAATVKSWIDEKKDFILLDVRTDKEVTAIAIPADGFKHYTRGLVEFYFTRDNPDTDATIVVYCKTGARAAMTVNRLKELGYKNVYNLEGGIVAWMKAKYELTNIMGTFVSTAKFE